MSLDRSLKGANSLVRHRNVLNRAERLEVLKDEEKWDDSKTVFGLPKVAHRKQAVVKTVKEEAVAGVEGGAVTAGAAPAAGAAAPAGKGAAAPAGKGAAAPAAGAKASAPAGKGKK